MVTQSRTKSQFERIDMPEDSSFAWKEISGRHFMAPFHHHPEIELTLITAGYGQRFVGNTVEPFQAGDVVLLGPHLPHAWFSDSRCRKSEAIVVQFHPETLGGGVLKAPELEAVRQLLKEAVQGIIVQRALAGEMLRRLGELSGLSPVQRLTLLLDVLEQVARAPESTARRLKAAMPEETVSLVDRKRLDEVLRYIHAHHQQAVTLTDVAKVAGLGPESFSRFFRRLTGRTFIETLIQIRLASAQALLRESTDTIAAVAYACGFEDLSNFNRQFRRAYGITPSEARRQSLTGPLGG
ncbi:AraC-type DNA-binding protein [Prosthecobacter debontii]|uniref:AraC-type DNA-binding protein n=2 Tax=Prosthecobacter debontii TaxID=48467 RepID=A0A1T4YR87_9BACT|nr:AraC-type DNA-binding protein [Prosthecobacter debontii]